MVNFARNVLALLGGIVATWAIAGSFDIGDFRLYYGLNLPPAEWCAP
jgi:hypothetical protein